MMLTFWWFVYLLSYFPLTFPLPLECRLCYYGQLLGCLMANIELQDPSENVTYEMDCPRCYSVMTLCFDPDSDNPFYTCDDCDFILHTTAKKE